MSWTSLFTIKKKTTQTEFFKVARLLLHRRRKSPVVLKALDLRDIKLAKLLFGIPFSTLTLKEQLDIDKDAVSGSKNWLVPENIL